MAEVFISSVVNFEKCDFFGMDSGTTSFYRIVQIFSIEVIENKGFHYPVAYLEHCQIAMMELFAKIVNS